MRVAHVLRKYNPAEWGGTETAVQRLLDGLAQQNTSSVVFAPAIAQNPETDPIRAAGHEVKRYRAFVPVARISAEQKSQLVAIGGNLMSYDIIAKLFRERGLSIIHTHTLNRIGGIALTVARARRLPLVATIHGGVLDLPASVRADLQKPLRGGFEWGKVFGLIFRSRQVLAQADAIIACNEQEAKLARQNFPGKNVLTQPHGVSGLLYQPDCREFARNAFPELRGQKLLLTVGRIDPIKNQLWLVRQLPALLARYPDAILVLAGACTAEAYGKLLKKEIRHLGLTAKVLLTGGLPPDDPRLIGLLQDAVAVVLPSVFETFGLVILEAWAAGRPVLSTRTPGACGLIQHGENGCFFDLADPQSFHQALGSIWVQHAFASSLGQAGQHLVRTQFDTNVLAGRVRRLYEQLVEKKNALRPLTRR
jgi:glycosyltransferase involved in cell wall biosynthesis